MEIINLKKDKYFLSAALVIHALWFIAAVFIFKRPYSYDSVEYIQLATNLDHGFFYSGNAALPVEKQWITLRPPVYPLFILMCWKLFGTHTWCILLLQNLLSIASMFITRKVFYVLRPDLKKEWIFWMLLFTFPMQMVFANMIFSDVLLQFFITLYFYQLVRTLSGDNPRRIWMMSVLLILGVLTKPILYPFLFLHAAFSLWLLFKSKRKQVVIAGIFPLLCLLGYGNWNRGQTGKFHISSIQSYNLLEYNLRDFYKFKYGRAESDRRMIPIMEQVNRSESFKEKYERSATIASLKIKEELLSYTAYHLLKSLLVFVDPNKLEFDIFAREFNYYEQTGISFYTSVQQNGLAGGWQYLKSYPYLPILLLTPLFGIFRLAGLLLFFFDKKNTPAIRIAIGIIVLYFVFITGPVANARYFLPILIITSGCAWTGYFSLWQKRQGKMG